MLAVYIYHRSGNYQYVTYNTSEKEERAGKKKKKKRNHENHDPMIYHKLIATVFLLYSYS
jgi:hypothetical protein